MLYQGAHLTGGHWTRKGDESLLKKLVAQHGAVVTTVAVHGSFMPYKGGIYQGCTNEETNHSVVVVGYGTENGVDYWLIKVGGTWLPGYQGPLYLYLELLGHVGGGWLHEDEERGGHVRHCQGPGGGHLCQGDRGHPGQLGLHHPGSRRRHHHRGFLFLWMIRIN